MNRLLPVLLAASASLACSSTPAASGPCGPCQSSSTEGLKNAGLPRSAKLEQLAAQRVTLARKRLVLLRTSFDRGVTTLDDLIAGTRDVAFAARDSGLHGETLRAILREYRDAVVALRDLTRERSAKGAVGEDAVTRMDALVAEAEFWLEDAR